MVVIYYINSKNEKIILNRWPYGLKNWNPQNWGWEYESVAVGNIGGRVRRLYKEVSEFVVTVIVRGTGRADRLRAVKRLYEVMEYDTVIGSPGKLYIGDQYMQCYATRSVKTTAEKINALVNEFEIVSPYPMWCRDEQISFYPGKDLGEQGMNYPYDHPYDYTQNNTLNYLVNTNSYADNYELTIYGPAVKPDIQIGENTCIVNAEINEGEYIKVNSRDRTIYKITRNGTMETMFNQREKDSGIFNKIQPGQNRVIYSGGFGFDIVLFHERSEPDWSLL